MTNASPRSPAVTRPFGVDGGGVVVVRQEDGQAGDVAVGAVGVAGPDGQLLGRALAVEDAAPGIEVDADDLGQLGDIVVGRPGLDPAVERPVQLAVRLEPLAAGVLARRRWPSRASVLSAGTARLTRRPTHLAGQAEMVALGVEAEEREPEPVLAARGAVAAPGVAAGLHEDRHHVEPEAERRLTVACATFTGKVTRLAAERDGERRRAVGRRVEGRPRRA